MTFWFLHKKILPLFLMHLILYDQVLGVDDNINKNSDDNDDDDDDEFKGCYDDDMNPYLLFSSKTSYKTVVQDELPIVTPPPDCSPTMIWMLIRHGIRYAVRIDDFQQLYKIRDEIIYNHENKKNVNLCEKDIENLRKWYFAMGSEQENMIHAAGLEEMKELAKRIKNKFPELIKPPYVPGNYVVYTPCIKSKITEVIKEKLEDYTVTDIFQKVQTNVMKKLGLNKLPPKSVTMMYKMCSLDKAWNYEKVSPWCSVFSTSDLKFLEYFEDYTYSIKSGYGTQEFTIKYGCPLVRDLVMRFKDINDGNTVQPNALFYMGHSTTINSLIVSLGIANDTEKLSANNYYRQINRKWKSSYNHPFGGNLAAIFYRCESNDNKVIIYLNEKPILIDGCESIMCSFNTFYEKYKDYIENKTCNAHEICKEEFSFWFFVLCGSIGTGFVYVIRYIINSLSKKNKFMYKYEKYFRKQDKRHMV
ncbi:multiple inositol polyphosphate phosphatase 1-like isoform X2 [Lycorma delicatula]|uniref:multiple inositol polyphosphate phosphatase 1-like isoform X2 n=1 Tax=Lycorma delicatula TaxID=130591 RepID=UPI003F50F6F5